MANPFLSTGYASLAKKQQADPVDPQVLKTSRDSFGDVGGDPIDVKQNSVTPLTPQGKAEAAPAENTRQKDTNASAPVPFPSAIPSIPSPLPAPPNANPKDQKEQVKTAPSYANLAKTTIGSTNPKTGMVPVEKQTPDPQFNNNFVTNPKSEPNDGMHMIDGPPQGDTITGVNPATPPKIYESVGKAGSGFINLSHLLGLNYGSGKASAADLAKKVRDQGLAAQGAISGAENDFNAAATAGSSWDNPDGFDPARSDAQSMIDAAKNAKYTGPNQLSEVGNYADLSKKVGTAQDSAKNLNGDGYSLAAEVNKETGLSPVQSAAGAFYMGVNNENLKSVGRQFSNLQSALDSANTRAMNRANLARQSATQYQGNADEWQRQLDDWNNPAGQVQTPAQILAADEANAQQRDDIMRNNHIKNNKPVNDSGLQSVTDANWAIGKGEPAEIAYAGVSYDQWVAMGKPSWEEYQKSHDQGSGKSGA